MLPLRRAFAALMGLSLGLASATARASLERLGSQAVVSVPDTPTGDMIVHFHGAPELVAGLYEHAELADAVVVIVNDGSVVSDYTSRYAGVGRWRELIGAAQALHEHPTKRIALSAFSAGFGAVLRALQLEAKGNWPGPELDAVLLFDGFHASRAPKAAWQRSTLQPVVAFAKRATEGEVLFSLTHSSIPVRSYPSTTESADVLLSRLGLEANASSERVVRPDLELLERWPGPASMTSRRKVEVGALSLSGFHGRDARAHTAHLQFMSVIGLEHLAARWR